MAGWRATRSKTGGSESATPCGRCIDHLVALTQTPSTRRPKSGWSAMLPVQFAAGSGLSRTAAGRSGPLERRGPPASSLELLRLLEGNPHMKTCARSEVAKADRHGVEACSMVNPCGSVRGCGWIPFDAVPHLDAPARGHLRQQSSSIRSTRRTLPLDGNDSPRSAARMRVKRFRLSGNVSSWKKERRGGCRRCRPFSSSTTDRPPEPHMASELWGSVQNAQRWGTAEVRCCGRQCSSEKSTRPTPQRRASRSPASDAGARARSRPQSKHRQLPLASTTCPRNGKASMMPGHWRRPDAAEHDRPSGWASFGVRRPGWQRAAGSTCSSRPPPAPYRPGCRRRARDSNSGHGKTAGSHQLQPYPARSRHAAMYSSPRT